MQPFRPGRNNLLEKSSEKQPQKAFKHRKPKCGSNRQHPKEETTTASKIIGILELLNDGQWHRIEEIERKMKLNESETKKIVAFLKEYNFIISEETRRAIKIEENARRFLMRTPNS